MEEELDYQINTVFDQKEYNRSFCTEHFIASCFPGILEKCKERDAEEARSSQLISSLSGRKYFLKPDQEEGKFGWGISILGLKIQEKEKHSSTGL